jgi:hypothetical protein
MNVPSNPLPVFVNVRVQKPLDGPKYVPVHVPLRSGGAAVAVDDGSAVNVGCTVGVGGAEWMAPLAINDDTPTTSTTAPSDSSVLYRLMPLLIIDPVPRRRGVATHPVLD